MQLTATQLRANIYRVLDQVLETGIPVEIMRKGGVLRIVPAAESDKLSRLVGHDDYLLCDPDDIVHMEWDSEWRP